MMPTNKKSALGAPSTKMYSDEASLLQKVVEWVEPQRRDKIFLMKIRDRYTRGYSDVFLCVQGIFVVAELKDDTGTASPQQKQFIKDIVDCGGIGAVCRTVAEVAALIDEAKRRVRNGYQRPDS